MDKLSNASEKGLAFSKKMTKKRFLAAQKLEITEHILYKKLADITASQKNKQTLNKIAEMELKHYHFFKEYTNEEVNPSLFKIKFYTFLSKIVGITFGVKLMERSEHTAQDIYKQLSKILPSAKNLLKDEELHEKQLLSILEEKHLSYTGSVVLGLNDALVELTGALAGLTFAFQNTRLIAIASLITGIAASLSMAASEYLSTKAEKNNRNPITSAIYTGIAYILTVIILVLPYFLFPNPYIDLAISLTLAICIIFMFTYYSSVIHDEPFRKRFTEMAGISLGVATLTFLIGFGIRKLIGIEI
jgi:VIT1/CCC1 family predicted Fe2+/Mn2+ transporter